MNPFPRFTYSGGLPTGAATVTLFNSATAGVRVSWPGANNKLALDVAASQSGTLVASKSVDGGLTWVQMESVAVTGSSTASTQDEWVVEPLADIRLQWTNGGVDQTVFVADMAFVPKNAATSSAVVEPRLLVFSQGQFNSTDGGTALATAATLTVYAADTPRIENRGDGEGGVWLFEKRRLNIAPRTENFDLAAWASLSSATVTPDNETSPTGVLTADTLSFAAVSNSRRQYTLTAANVPSSTTHTFSCWIKSGTGSNLFKFGIQDKSAATSFSPNKTATGTWVRHDWSVNSGAGAGNPIVMASTADATVHNVVAWGYQVETSPYPTSYIPNTASTQNAVGSEDVLMFLASQVPLALRAGVWRVSLYPYYANTDLASGDVFWVVSFVSGSDGIRIRHTGADVRLEAVVGGSVVASSNALTFARMAKLSCVVDLPAGQLTVNASAGAAAGVISFPAGVTRVGGIVGGAGEFNGRISEMTE